MSTYSDEKKTMPSPYDNGNGNGNGNGKGSVGGKTEITSVEIYDPSKESVWTRLGLNFESFKRAPGTTKGIVTHGDIPIELDMYDHNLLQQKMKPRHLQMIAAGGAIGTGLFVGTGGALATGGPAGILLGWLIMGFMMVNITQALGELSTLYPVDGGFFGLACRFLDPSLGAALGFNYAFQWLCTLPLELTVAASTVMFWDNPIPLAAWITIFWAIITLGVLFGTLGYAEEEFWTSCLKILVIIIFVFVAVICVAGAGPASGEYSSYVGARYWHDPGAFAYGFKGVCSVFVTAAFSYSGSELVSFAASETPDPMKSMPKAIKGVIWRVIILFLIVILMIGLAIPHNEPMLLEGDGANGSPMVILMRRAHIPGLDHLVNVTVLIAVLSMGLSCVYGGTRPLLSLANQGYLPDIFRYVDKSSRPIFCILAVMILSPLAYINVLEDIGTQVFDWLIGISGLSTLFTWLAVCITHLRFRKAWRVQGHSVDELPFQAFGGEWGSIIGAILVTLVIISQFYIAVWPVSDGTQPETPGEKVQYFFMIFISVPILALMWFGMYLWKRTTPKKASEIDLVTGRKIWLTAEELNAIRAARRNKPWHIRIYQTLFA